jgi:hypothetical protein
LLCLLSPLAVWGQEDAVPVEEEAEESRGFALDMLETDDLRLLYFGAFQSYLVPHVSRNFHNSHDFQREIFDWTPNETVTVLLKDFSDYGNAGAAVTPFNGVAVDIAPPSHTLETIPGSERFFSLMNHELVHIATMDVANDTDIKWRRFFGGKPRESDKHPESIIYGYLATPRFASPRWYAEGSAVFFETWMSGGIGRVQGAYDEMVFRAMVRDDAHFYSNLGLVSHATAVDFQVGANAYLYGTRFFSYLSYTYSPEQVVDWLSRSEDSERYYERQFRHVFDKPMVDAWDDWIAFEKEFQGHNLERIRTQELTHVEPLVDSALGSISRSYYDPVKQSMIGAFRKPGVVAHVGALSLENGEVEHLVDIKRPMLYRVTSTAWDPASRTLFYTNDNLAYRDLMAVDVDTGEDRLLIKDARIGDLAFNKADGSLWGLRHLNGYVTLVRMPAPYDQWDQVHTWPYGEDLFELSLSDDGSLLSTSMSEINGDMFLRVFRTEDLLSRKFQHIRQFDFGTAVPEGFVFTADGKYLYGSTYYTGVSNIVRYEIANGDIQWVSNAETGLFRPIPLEDGRVLVFEYAGQGFRPGIIDPVPLEDVSNIIFLGSEIARKHPVVQEWNVVSGLKDIDPDALVNSTGKYHPFRELQWSSGYPVIEGYRGEVALGYHAQWQDPAQLHRFEMTGSYSWNTPSDESLHFNAEYHGLNWWGRYWHNDADFYDLFGPKERSRKGDAFFIGYDKALIFDVPRRLDLYAEVALYTGLDTLPDNQNRPTFFIEDILRGQIGLNYTNTRKSLGAVDHEKGWKWNAHGQVDHSEFDTIPKLRGSVDFGFALPWKHSSFWFYTAAGWADGNRLDPLTNYYFGGFQNNYVDDREVKRYRNWYSMPGFEIDQIAGREFGKLTAEFNLPPYRFREAGVPSFFLKHIRPAIFAMALVTDPGEVFERTTQSVGFQVDLEFTLIHRLPMTLSVGWAAGFEDGNKRDDEVMVSLKIL